MIKVENISKFYKNKKVLDDVSVSISKGEVVGIIGHNGAGKSTIMGIITGLIPKFKGEVIFSEDICRKKKRNQKTIGSMIETPSFFENMTGMENLKYCVSMNNMKLEYEQIQKYVELLELTDVIHHKVKSYSVGMRKKLDFLQAICGEPDIVILDEPTNGVDPQGVVVIRNIIAEISNKGAAVLVSSHQLSEVKKICNRVVVLYQGKIIEEIVVDENTDDDFLEKLYIKRISSNE